MEKRIKNNASNGKADWRFQGQDKYLMHVQLMFSKFDGAERNHDHCGFCSEKFSEDNDDLHEGYCTLNKYHWICESCFNDFKEIFKWTVVDRPM